MKSKLLLDFFRETLNRFLAKNPKYFNILSYIATAAWVVTGLPGLLEDLHWTMPPAWQALSSQVVSVASITVIVLSNLTTKRQVVNTSSPTGANLVKTDPKVLPFTTAAEKKEI